jgi:hypothetical protein
MLFLPLSVVVLLPLVAAWSRWLRTDRRSLRGPRVVLFWIGLSTATIAWAEFSSFCVYVASRHELGNDFATFLAWARPGFYVSLAGVVLATAGVGRSRLLAVAPSSLLLALWIILVEAM